MLIPRLLGLVSSGKDVLGILLEYVDGKVLGQMNLSKRPLEKRKDWAEQIENTVKRLHRHDIVWGDAKAGNVLIDEEDNAWLIDFGGVSRMDGLISSSKRPKRVTCRDSGR